jgi:hypothetical protein
MDIDIKGSVTLYKLGPTPGEIDRAGSVVVTYGLRLLLCGIWYRMPSVSGLMPFLQSSRYLIHYSPT